MQAYRTTGGPCHWDLTLCFFVFLGPRYARRRIGNVESDEGRQRLRQETRRQIDRLQKQFDQFFNPQKRQQVWELYQFGACCSFHIDAEFRFPPAEWSGLEAREIEERLPEGCGILIVDSIGMTEHPHASLAGRRVLVDEDNDRYTLAHELGHILGLPDHYRTPDVPSLGVTGNGMTPEEEVAHRGHLMGKKDGQGRRAIQPHEIQEIAQLTGMTCDRSVCCPDKDRKSPDQEAPEDKGMKEKTSRAEPAGTRGGPACGLIAAHGGAVTAFDLAREWLSEKELRDFLKNVRPVERPTRRK